MPTRHLDDADDRRVRQTERRHQRVGLGRVAARLVGLERPDEHEQLVERRHALAALRRVRGPARDGQPERDRAGVGDHDVEVGGLGDDRQVAGDPARIAASVPARRPPRTARGRRAARHRAVEVAGRAERPRPRPGSAATPPFMSQAPRPYRRAVADLAAHGSTVQVAGSPGGTTSRWPTGRSAAARRPPARRSRPAGVARHLLAGPVGVGADRRRVRVRRPRPAARAARSASAAQVGDGLLGPGDARDPDQRAQVGDAAPSPSTASTARMARRQSRRIGRVMHVGPPEPLTPISVAG